MAKLKAHITGYFSAQSFLHGRKKRILGHETRVVQDSDGTIWVRLFGNNIASYTINEMCLYDGGWQTKTTKDRLRQLLPDGWMLFSIKYQWYLSYKGQQKIPFVSGMVINSHVLITSKPYTPTPGGYVDKLLTLNKQLQGEL